MRIQNQKIKYILILLTLIFSIGLYAQDLTHKESGQTETISGSKLPALRIIGDYISPEKGIDSLVLRDLLIKKLKNDGIKGDINSVLKVEEKTTNEIWDNIGVQLYQVVVDYAWINGIAVVKNDEVLTILSGMPTEAVFIADLDDDSFYEIYINIFLGSGIISEEILGYNVALNESYRLSKRMEHDLHLYIDNEKLMAEIRPYSKNGNNQNISVGDVNLKEFNNKNKLSIQVK